MNICRAIESAGAKWVMLNQVQSADLEYDGEGHLTQGVTALGSLNEASAKYVRVNTWHDSNAAEAVGNVGIVLFTGGEDISPSLYFSPEPWHGIVEEIDFCAERDVSDYLTMTYCLDHDIPVMGFCRGMQMLSVVSGAETIQVVPAYFSELGVPMATNIATRRQRRTPIGIMRRMTCKSHPIHFFTKWQEAMFSPATRPGTIRRSGMWTTRGW